MSLENKINSGLLTRIGRRIKSSLTAKILAYSFIGTLAFGTAYSLNGCGSGGGSSNGDNGDTIKRYSCNNDLCVEDTNGIYAVADCNNFCSNPLTKYSCSGNSCIVDSNGTFTTSTCNNACKMKYIFVTSQEYGGNFGGLVGADAECKRLADIAADAGLLNAKGSSWKAWLSDSNTNAIDRIADVGPWFLNNTAKVFNNKAHVALNPASLLSTININEKAEDLNVLFPNYVLYWTGTLPGGTKDVYNCSNWGSSSSESGTFGRSNYINNGWTDNGNAGCSNPFHLVCFEQ